MTEGQFSIYLGEQKYLVCNISHDGYQEGLGYALLASSQDMQKFINITMALGGNLCYQNQNTKEISFAFEPSRYYKASDKQKESYEEAMNLVLTNNLEAAQKLDFWSIPIEEKDKNEWCEKSAIENINYTLIDSTNIKNLYDIVSILHSGEDTIEASYNYIWRHDQLYQEVYDTENDKTYLIPFVACVFFSNKDKPIITAQGCYANIEDYFNLDLTQKDGDTLKSMYGFNKKKKRLYMADFTLAKMEKYDLETAILPANLSMNKSSSKLKI